MIGYNQSANGHYNVSGYRNWYRPFYYNERKTSYKAFIVDFETFIYKEQVPKADLSFEELEKNIKKQRYISGIIVYFLDGNGEKRRAFLKHRPYFYLLPNESIQNDKKKLNNLCRIVERTDRKRIHSIEIFQGYDSEDLVFLKEKSFIKVIVNTPSDVPKLRDKCENLSGVKEWREADILFHHRVAIDTGLRIGKWFLLDINEGEIQSLTETTASKTPELKIVAYDIEVENPRTRDPSIEKDEITMVSLFNGTRNVVVVNSNVVNCEEAENIYVILQNKEGSSLPYVEWSTVDDKILNDPSIKEKRFTEVQVVKDEKELITRFIRYIDDEKPDIIADFYGDKFDMPYLIGRANKYGINIQGITGFDVKWKLSARNKDRNDKNLMQDVESVASYGPMHLDAYLWNEKYSYLPKKDLGLKPSVKARLKIIPIDREALWGVDENPTEAIAYNASDGYITWRYVKEIILDFVFSIGQMFPVPANELLTKTAGSLDDLLVDGIGHTNRVVAKKRISQFTAESFSKNIIMTNIAYTGGMVGALHPGIWRSDIEYNLPIDEEEIKNIIKKLPTVYQKTAQKLLDETKKNHFEKEMMSFFGDKKDQYYQYLSETDEENYIHKALQFLGTNKSRSEYIELKREIDEITAEISQFEIRELESKVENLVEALQQAEQVSNTRKVKPIGLHIDVTSMYPSQIRQYKIQPSGLVHPDGRCKTCPYKESNGACWVEQTWTAKLTARKPCLNKKGSFCSKLNKKCPFTVGDEENCNYYESNDIKAQEFWSFKNNRDIVYRLTDDDKLERIKKAESFLGNEIQENSTTKSSVYSYFKNWVSSKIDGTTITNEGLGNIGIALLAPKNAFLYLDTKSKNITFLLSVKSRFCQKAYSHVHAVMDDFFKMRVFHKKEAKRIERIIKMKEEQNEPVSEELHSKYKFHNSTQLGLKVPLNSIYGLLGMKAGVHNASLPCAGATTALSASLIKWGVDKIKKLGKVTEFDSLDYSERIILKDPKNMVRVVEIGKFVENCFNSFGTKAIDSDRNVDYAEVDQRWKALSATSKGKIEWQPIKMAIRQKTARDVNKIQTPFGSVKTTDSHSIFINDNKTIVPIEVKHLKDHHITHICEIPDIERDIRLEMTNLCDDLELFVYIPKKFINKDFSQYPTSKIRKSSKNITNTRITCYKVPLQEYNGPITDDLLVGTKKSNIYPLVIPLTEDIAELAGWFVAEGSSDVYNGKISVGISQQNKDNLNRIRYLIKKIARRYIPKYTVKPVLFDKKSNTYRLEMDNAFFYHLFTVLGCGHNAFNKRISSSILSARKSVKKAFFKGYLDGDGTFTGKRTVFHTVSDGLKDDLFVLGKQLGYIVSIQESFSKSSGSKVYMVHYMDEKNWKAGSRPHYDYKKLGNTIGLAKKSLQKVKKTNEYVYDIAVAVNNNFVSANGGILCHNTDGIWCFVPQKFPTKMNIEVVNSKDEIILNRKIPLLEEIINEEIEQTMTNENYWEPEKGKSSNFKRKEICLLKFEQDGPYNFQFVMGKKKYIVFNYDEKNKRWIEKEITGLETKRADFSNLHKNLQMDILHAFLVNYQKPDMTIEKLYQNAVNVAVAYIKKIERGQIDIEDFVESKALSKPPEEYTTILPQVAAAYMLQELGFNIEIGQRIEMLKVKSAGDKISESVVPKQLFDFPFEKVKHILKKHQIGNMVYMFKNIETVNELKKEILDIDGYIDDLIGKDRIIDRMILQPMQKQNIRIKLPLMFKKNLTKKKTKTMNIMNIAKTHQKRSKRKNKPIKKSKTKARHQVPISLKDEKVKKTIDQQNVSKTSIKIDTSFKTLIPTSNKVNVTNKDLFSQWSAIIPYKNGTSSKKQSESSNGLYKKLKSYFSLDEILELTDGESTELLYCPNCNIYYEVFHDNVCSICMERLEYIYDLKEYLLEAF